MATDVVGIQLDLGLLMVMAPLAAIVGAQLGHYLGVKFGRP